MSKELKWDLHDWFEFIFFGLPLAIAFLALLSPLQLSFFVAHFHPYDLSE